MITPINQCHHSGVVRVGTFSAIHSVEKHSGNSGSTGAAAAAGAAGAGAGGGAAAADDACGAAAAAAVALPLSLEVVAFAPMAAASWQGRPQN